MSFLLECPFCGPRSVYDFRFGGEIKPRPEPGAGQEAWLDFVYWKTNAAGFQDEWWYHASGCKQWFRARRNTVTNEVIESRLSEPE